MSLHELDLAQKISDCVICVHGDKIEKYGSPEEIFSSDMCIIFMGLQQGATMLRSGAWKWKDQKESRRYL